MTGLPSGTVTLLFTDIEGSTALLAQLGRDRYSDTLAQHTSLLVTAFAAHEGRVVDTQGDSFFVAFRTAADGVAAAVEAQRELAVHSWPGGAAVKVRMGLHTGEPKLGDERYVGIGVHRAARIGAAGHGGQVLLSSTTKELAEEELPPGVSIRDLGEVRLKGIEQPQRVYQLVVAGLESEFAQLETLDVDLGRRRRRMYVVAALICVTAVAVAIPVIALGRGGSGGGPTVEEAGVAANALAVIDAERNRVVGAVPVGERPTFVAVGAGAVWVANVSDRTVSRVDADSLSVTATVGLGFEPTDLAADDEFVWVVGGYDHALWRLDRDGTARLKTRFVERFGPLPEGHDRGAAGIALGPGVVWLTHGDEVSAIDPETGIAVSSVKAGGRWQRAIASEDNTVWVGYDDSVLADVGDHFGPDPRVDVVSVPDRVVVDSAELSSRAGEVIVASGSVWIALPVPGLVSQLVGDRVLRTVPAGNEPVGLAFADGSLWVTNQRDGLVRRLNVSTGDAEAVIDLGHTVEDVDAAGGRVYVAVRKP